MAPRPGAKKARREDSLPQQAPLCAATGTAGVVAPPTRTNSATSVPAAEARITELRAALEHRKSSTLIPYRVEAWESLLHRCNLYVKYPNLTLSLRKGFDAGIQPIYTTSTPANSPSLLLHLEAYQEMVTKEFSKGRYIGPCTRQEVEWLIGPFQSSPLSWVPKPGKPGKYRAVHNFSYPHTPTPTTTSIIIIPLLMQTLSHALGARSLPFATPFLTSLPGRRQLSVTLLRLTAPFPSPLTSGQAWLSSCWMMMNLPSTSATTLGWWDLR